MDKTHDSIEAFIVSTLRENFNVKQQEERHEFEKTLPQLVEKRKAAALAALQGDPAFMIPAAPMGKRRGRPPGTPNAPKEPTPRRSSWTALSDAKKEKWIGEIIEAGKAKTKREALMKSFAEAEGFKLRESIIDRVQITRLVRGNEPCLSGGYRPRAVGTRRMIRTRTTIEPGVWRLVHDTEPNRRITLEIFEGPGMRARTIAIVGDGGILIDGDVVMSALAPRGRIVKDVPRNLVVEGLQLIAAEGSEDASGVTAWWSCEDVAGTPAWSPRGRSRSFLLCTGC